MSNGSETTNGGLNTSNGAAPPVMVRISAEQEVTDTEGRAGSTQSGAIPSPRRKKIDYDLALTPDPRPSPITTSTALSNQSRMRAPSVSSLQKVTTGSMTSIVSDFLCKKGFRERVGSIGTALVTSQGSCGSISIQKRPSGSFGWISGVFGGSNSGNSSLASLNAEKPLSLATATHSDYSSGRSFKFMAADSDEETDVPVAGKGSKTNIQRDFHIIYRSKINDLEGEVYHLNRDLRHSRIENDRLANDLKRIRTNEEFKRAALQDEIRETRKELHNMERKLKVWKSIVMEAKESESAWQKRAVVLTRQLTQLGFRPSSEGLQSVIPERFKEIHTRILAHGSKSLATRGRIGAQGELELRMNENILELTKILYQRTSTSSLKELPSAPVS